MRRDLFLSEREARAGLRTETPAGIDEKSREQLAITFVVHDLGLFPARFFLGGGTILDVFRIETVERFVGQLASMDVEGPADEQTRAATISARLTAKRYRKSRLDLGVALRIREVAERVVRTESPLRLLVPIGGYKSPASVESGVGWAEMFAVLGFSELSSRICAVHPPGVRVEFSSDDAVAPMLTGASPATLRRYASDFEAVLELGSTGGPVNLSLRQTALSEHYDVEDLLRRIEAEGDRLQEGWFNGLAPAEKGRHLRGARNNDHVGSEDGAASGLIRRVCQHQAFIQIDARERCGALYRWDTVPVALREGIPGWLHLGSNRRSATQFWMGTGVLDLSGKRPAAHILPPRRARELVPTLARHTFVNPSVAGLRELPVIPCRSEESS